jgi:hypothetical protein
MENNHTNGLISCPHCAGKGTCLIDNSNSCGTCLKHAKAKKHSKIVICSVCGGTGITEAKTDRLKNRTPFFIMAIVLIVFYFYTGINVINSNNFDKIFPVVGSLTTMIVTFYFSQRNNQS